MMSFGIKSYASWAQCLASITGKVVSRQAIFERMNSAWIGLVKQLLEIVMAQQAVKQTSSEIFKHFNRVLLQDSTTLHLPDCLSGLFKGNVSRGKAKAVAKLNIVMDVISGKFLFMKWMSFTVTEQALSGNILGIASSSDLVIRDLGYSVLRIFQDMNEKGIYFLSRLRYGLSLFAAKSGEPIDILKLLKGKAFVDHRVLCGKDKKLKVRLVAIRLSPEQAAQRRRKAKQDRDKRLNHSKEYYTLLDYVIFITNVTENIWNYRQAAAAYRVRWNIEILFKSWKSGLKIKHLIPEDIKHTERVESILYMMMLYVVWFQLLMYIPVKWYAEKHGHQISILKLANRMTIEATDWLTSTINNAFKRELMQQCRYDIRHDRINAVQRLELFFSSLA